MHHRQRNYAGSRLDMDDLFPAIPVTQNYFYGIVDSIEPFGEAVADEAIRYVWRGKQV